MAKIKRRKRRPLLKPGKMTHIDRSNSAQIYRAVDNTPGVYDAAFNSRVKVIVIAEDKFVHFNGRKIWFCDGDCAQCWEAKTGCADQLVELPEFLESIERIM